MFKLQPPESFPATVDIVSPGGTVDPLEVEFKWMSREEFIAYCETHKESGDAAFFLGLLKSWDADEPLDEAGIKKLFGYRPKASRALFEKYRSELLEVEEKN